MVHELAITESVVDAVAERLPGARVTCVRLEIGALSGVMADSVRFCFDMVTEGTNLEGARLEITETAGRCHCGVCGTDFEPDGAIALCPCGSIEFKVISGQELKIASVQCLPGGTTPPDPPQRWPDLCATCGCSGSSVARLLPADLPGRARPRHRHERVHHHAAHDAAHEHAGDEHDRQHHDSGHILRPQASGDERTVDLQQKVLAKNDRLAEFNREWLRQRSVLAINLMSSPGAGKTTLLERTARELAGKVAISVIEGDQAGALDAERIQAAGCRVVQINTGSGCHLDAAMVAEGLRLLDPPGGSVVMIENVGNLVCPALFDLGEQARVVIASVAEGDDKPLKYPHMFRRADLVLLNKIDLLPYVDFDLKRHATDVRKVSPGALMLQLSAAAGAGMPEWYAWLRRRTPAPHE